MLKQLNRLLIFILLLGTVTFIGADAYQQYTKPVKYELIGIASSTRLNDRGFSVSPHAFQVDAKQLARGETYIPLLIDHKNSVHNILGKVVALEITSEGTLFKAEITATRENQVIINKMLRKDLVGISVGFAPILFDNNQVVIGDLMEISVVGIGADPGARILYIGPVEEE